ncbi:carboxymuconolactone decarboxylase family protein [Trinickia dinghuensis]|uniref:Carboxymuconolactone decarboxylase family protein n=1 Tax=Trinickia dinghuensis TaxID=2291023 RepID=A0A3D8JYD4_9BURK|nr:carboxymuconolactone decarboxylase family protein [Trinickia dinghuensis]RDU97634.1 carboxymuconolactone decarboxylase family protein [Trinickia dinghuensis]
MSRLPAVPAEETSDASRALFDRIRKAVGKVPNAYALIGSYSPAALELSLKGDAVLAGGTLTKTEIESIRIAVSALNGCDYCVAAHTMVGKMAGLPPEALRQLRTGEPTGDARRDALVTFARTVAGTRGTVDESVLAAVREAGYSPAQVTEALLAISLISFTNLFNRVNDTDIDFPIPR